MDDSFIPPFDPEAVFILPWAEDFYGTLWTVVMGFLVCLSCGLVGNFLIVRRMALVGDAISHSLLPGIVLAFLLTSTLAVPVMVAGAVVAGVLTTVLIEFIHRNSRVKTDAALGIVFTTFFAVGVILVSVFVGKVHFDADCVLYGELEYVSLGEPLTYLGRDLLPWPVFTQLMVAGAVLGLLILFYKELLVTSFDPGLARSLGVPVNVFHYGLMAVLSVVVVSAFESVGVILVIAMLIFPGVTGMMLTDRFPLVIAFCFPAAAAYALGGFHLAKALECSTAAAMAVVAGAGFAATWVFSPSRGLAFHRWRQRATVADGGEGEGESGGGGADPQPV